MFDQKHISVLKIFRMPSRMKELLDENNYNIATISVNKILNCQYHGYLDFKNVTLQWLRN
jgi:hypothetical protein